MSLAQYLALGKSIENVSGAGRYKVSGQPVAPNFSGGREIPEPEPEPEPESAEVNVFQRVAQPVMPAESVAAPAVVVPGPTPAVKEVPAAVAAPKTVKTAGSAPGTRWFFGGRPARRRADRRALPPEQRELELGMVAPVRNDLSESDLEVVPVMPAVTPTAASWWARMWRRAAPWLPGRFSRRLPG